MTFPLRVTSAMRHGAGARTRIPPYNRRVRVVPKEVRKWRERTAATDADPSPGTGADAGADASTLPPADECNDSTGDRKTV